VDHAELTQLAAGAALDDLDPAERAELDAHLAGCARCRSLVVELEDLLGDLALAAPELRPPAHLRADVMASLRAAEPGDTPTGRPATVHVLPRRRPSIGRLAGLAIAAGLAVVAVGLGARTIQVEGELAAVSRALAEAEARDTGQLAAMALIADPAHVTVALHPEPIAPDTNAVVLYRPGTTEAFLMATDLPATPAGSVYQLWVADADGVHPLGTFAHDGSGPVVAPFGVDLATGAAAMVTLEPVGGAVGEPGPEVVFGEL
jgi:anti-sigma-K factor RskA